VTFVSIEHDIERLRSRAAHYHREAARSRQRARLVYCRVLAAHLEREATELERLIKREPSSTPVDGDIAQSAVESLQEYDKPGKARTITGLSDQ
jgi:hypothetical protein